MNRARGQVLKRLSQGEFHWAPFDYVTSAGSRSHRDSGIGSIAGPSIPLEFAAIWVVLSIADRHNAVEPYSVQVSVVGLIFNLLMEDQ